LSGSNAVYPVSLKNPNSLFGSLIRFTRGLHTWKLPFWSALVHSEQWRAVETELDNNRKSATQATLLILYVVMVYKGKNKDYDVFWERMSAEVAQIEVSEHCILVSPIRSLLDNRFQFVRGRVISKHLFLTPDLGIRH
jgi:hypothetical protein